MIWITENLDKMKQKAELAQADPVMPADISPELLGDSDTPPPDPPTIVDTVIDHLHRDRITPHDRGRLTDAVNNANARASSDKAPKPFGNIVGRVPSGLEALTGRLK